MAKRLTKLLSEEREGKKDRNHQSALREKKSKFSKRVKEEEDNGTLVQVDGGFHSLQGLITNGANATNTGT